MYWYAVLFMLFSHDQNKKKQVRVFVRPKENDGVHFIRYAELVFIWIALRFRGNIIVAIAIKFHNVVETVINC